MCGTQIHNETLGEYTFVCDDITLQVVSDFITTQVSFYYNMNAIENLRQRRNMVNDGAF